ncbi:hypothetical protein GCM10022222_23030 [Amycolatopsis ultiminotia]|uniref:Uncharacterized protein n=1 Tax=Amycolatopsis ultiminotia TaxID=543629 RepID=A0ABP6VTE2_9PSEU
MDAVLFGIFSTGVQEYLQGVVGTANASGTASATMPVSVRGAPGEVARLAAAWRALLKQHALAADGRCVVCGRSGAGGLAGIRRWPIRRRPGMCTVWQVAVAYFIRRLPTADP